MNKFAAKGDVKRLIKALDYTQDQRVGENAATALEAIGGPAVEPLIVDSPARCWAATLGEGGSEWKNKTIR